MFYVNCYVNQCIHINVTCFDRRASVNVFRNRLAGEVYSEQYCPLHIVSGIVEVLAWFVFISRISRAHSL